MHKEPSERCEQTVSCGVVTWPHLSLLL